MITKLSLAQKTALMWSWCVAVCRVFRASGVPSDRPRYLLFLEVSAVCTALPSYILPQVVLVLTVREGDAGARCGGTYCLRRVEPSQPSGQPVARDKYPASNIYARLTRGTILFFSHLGVDRVPQLPYFNNRITFYSYGGNH